MSIVSIHFFPIGSRISKRTLQPGAYKKGSAKLTPNSSQLVNRLWVKGGKTTSDIYSQNITAGTEAIPLHYNPRAPVTVVIGGVEKSLGIQHIHEAGTMDFLVNSSEKLLIPDLCTSGSGTISYKYEYPIKILLEEPSSIEKYGVFEDILRVDTDDKDLALDLGLRHLFKYSQPVIGGSIEPFEGVYKPGEYILTQISELNIDKYLEIKEVTYDSIPGKSRVDIKLQLESPDRDVSNILKDLSQRLFALEKAALKDDEGLVEYYIAKQEVWAWLEVAQVAPPIQSAEWTWWLENVAKIPPIEIEEGMNWVELLQLDTEIFARETLSWQELLKIASDIYTGNENHSWGEQMLIDNEIQIPAESLSWAEEHEVILDYGIFPEDTLYPGDSLYPKDWS